MTAQGHPRAIFTRAIENGNLGAAEVVAREVGNLSLEEALRLLFLYAAKDPIKYERRRSAGSPATSAMGKRSRC